MIRSALALLGAAFCMALPAHAQTFTHSTGHNGYQVHDITTYVTHGTCCQAHHSCTSQHSHSAHHGHTVTNTTTRVVRRHSAPVSHHRQVKSHTVPVRRVYAQPAPRTVYVQPAPRVVHTPAPVYPRYSVQHDDRAEPWAHYDRHWKSRTHVKRHKRYKRHH